MLDASNGAGATAMTFEDDVAKHYTSGDLLDRIDAALKDAGADPAHPGFDALKPVDEFHTGGIEATVALLDQLDLAPGADVIDLGCGLGGTARHILHRYGAKVRGIDLTPAFVEAGRALNDRLGLSQGITLEIGSVHDLPWEAASADLVTMFHVGMNISDKKRLFAEAARVLKPGGQFALFDVMRDEVEDELTFPLPWAEVAELSHVEAPAVYHHAAYEAGLTEDLTRDRRDFTLDFFSRVSRLIAAQGMPPVGIHLLMRETAGQKIENYVANVQARRIAPVEMIFTKG